MITKDELDDAVNEFIESQKFRDRHLYQKFKDEIGRGDDEEAEDEGENPPNLVSILKKGMQLPAEEEETEEEKQERISNFNLV